MDDIRTAWNRTVQNPSLVVVLLLELVLSIPITVIMSLFIYAGMTAQDITAMYISLGGLLVMLLFWICLDAFFKSGLFGMSKNVVQDGSTSIREFLPTGRRYFRPMLAMHIALYVIMVIPGIPDVVSMFTQQPASLGLKVGLIVIVGALLFYWLLWVPAAIVFDNKSFLESLKISSVKANSESKHTFMTALISIVLIGVAFFAAEGLARIPPVMPESQALAMGMSVVIYIVFSISIVLVTLYVFARYNTQRKKARKSRKKRKK